MKLGEVSLYKHACYAGECITVGMVWRCYCGKTYIARRGHGFRPVSRRITRRHAARLLRREARRDG